MGDDAMACPPRRGARTHCDEPMAKPKTEKKAAIAAPVSRVLLRDLQLGDRLVDERGEWRVSDEDASPGWRRAFVDSRLTSSSVPPQRVAGPRPFPVSPVTTFAPFSSL